MGTPGSIDDIQPFAELAQNATTSVYKAYQSSLERFVLLKRLRHAVSTDEELAARFQEEARIAARIQHPNVVSIYAFGSDEEGAYFVAEFIDGLDLGELIERSVIPVDISLYVLQQAAKGLRGAHEKNILHRDLKPSNILVSRSGEVKLSDFGLASICGPSENGQCEVRGTLPYLAPEQILESEADERSDLFSLGATFFEMLTGRRAFPGSTTQEIFDAILNRDPIPFLSTSAGVDAATREICAKLLARNLSGRYQSASELIDAVAACRARRPAAVDASVLSTFVEDPDSFEPPRAVPARVDRAPEVTIVRSEPRRRRQSPLRMWQMAAVTAVALSFAAVLVYAGVTMFRPPPGARAFAEMSLRNMEDSVRIDTLDLVNAGDLAQSAAGAESTAVPPVATSELASPPPRISSRARARGTRAAANRRGMLRITVDTSAAVFVGTDSAGMAYGGQPLFVQAPPGRHEITLRNPAFPLEERSIYVRAADTINVDVSLWSTVGRLALQVSPWANVYIDDRHVGQTPLREPIVLLPGVRELRLVNPEMGVDHTTTITVPKGEVVSRSFILSNL